jgi:hypothetical protein
LDVRAKKVGRQLQRQVGISGYEAARIFAKPKKTRKKQVFSSSLLYALVAFRNTKKTAESPRTGKIQVIMPILCAYFFLVKRKRCVTSFWLKGRRVKGQSFSIM